MSTYAPIGKLDRALKHLSNLDDALQRYRDSTPYTLEFKALPEIHNAMGLWKMRISWNLTLITPPSPTWGLIFGDFLTNLRAALDQTVYDLQTAQSQLNDKQKRDSQFIILGSHPTKSYDSRFKEAASKNLPGLTASQQNIIRLEQPDKTPQGTDSWAELLNHLVNTDKHRTRLPVSYQIEITDVHVKSPRSPALYAGSMENVTIGKEFFEPGKTVTDEPIAHIDFTVPASGIDPRQHFDVSHKHYMVEIINIPGLSASVPIGRALSGLFNNVAHTVAQLYGVTIADLGLDEELLSTRSTRTS